MFDIGFAEIVLIAIVGLLVIGPDRLPGAIRTGSAWLGQIRRSFNSIRDEVQRELHNDEIMRQLRESNDSLKREVQQVNASLDQSARQAEVDLQSSGDSAAESAKGPEA